MASIKRVLIYGGRGALGSAVVKHFKQQNWWVACIDLADNGEASANIKLTSTNDWLAQEQELLSQTDAALAGAKVDAVICVAGGWAGGSASSADFIKNTDLMVKQSVWTSALSAKLASKYLADGGLLTLTGAKAALDGTPGMIGYGLAKAAVHHLARSLAKADGGLPTGASVLSILPVTLDTEMNRKWMPNANHGEWTPLPFVAELLFRWAMQPADRPTSGSLVQLITSESQTKLEIA